MFVAQPIFSNGRNRIVSVMCFSFCHTAYFMMALSTPFWSNKLDLGKGFNATCGGGREPDFTNADQRSVDKIVVCSEY